MVRTNVRNAVLIAGLLALTAAHAAQAPSPYVQEVRAGLEEIYAFRTTRTEHHSGTTAACASAPFHPVNTDYYESWSIGLRSTSSRVIDTHEREVGGFTACFGPLTRDQPLQMFATGSVAHIPWTGVGECLPLPSRPPVQTLLAFTCNLRLSGLPPAYTGGFGVSSTLAPFISRAQPATAHVPGYLSTSVVVIRLWRKPTAAPREGPSADGG